jgi:Xaa-Pro aminopeptidase
LVNVEIYKRRRETVMQKIDNGTAIFGSTKSCNHGYRQDSNLFYLTGFKEPESILVLAPNHPEHKTIIFLSPKDRNQEIWTGKRLGVENAKDELGVDVAYSIADLDNTLPKYFDNVEKIYYTIGNNENLDNKVLNLLKQSRGKRYESLTGLVSIVDPAEIIRDMRAIKDAHEIDLIRKAAAISAEGHISAMKAVKSGMYEYELQAILEYDFMKNGADEPAYPSIVGSGANATCLHYETNNCLIKDGDLILIDAGAEYGHYSADITRTFPANGKFTDIQSKLYNIVLDAQMAAIDEIKSGNKLDAYHDKAVQVLVDGLMGIGLLKGEKDKIMEEKAFSKFYMHGTGHWMGMDVHDVGSRKIGDEMRVFEPGMIVTVEPGLYIAEDLEDIEEQYKGIGIRIEDDVLVTENGNEVLTSAVPKKIEDIEKLMVENFNDARKK